ncbi:hypothetical protein ACJ41O_005560 [Fusarium nematophilum]
MPASSVDGTSLTTLEEVSAASDVVVEVGSAVSNVEAKVLSTGTVLVVSPDGSEVEVQGPVPLDSEASDLVASVVVVAASEIESDVDDWGLHGPA